MQTISSFLSATRFKLLPNSSPSARPIQGKGQTAGFSCPKLLTFLLLLLLTARLSSAQDVSTYQLAATSGTFTPVTGGTPIAILAQADAISPVIALPFTFYYGGVGFTTLQAASRGYMVFNPQSFAYSNNTLGLANNTVAPLWDELSGVGGTASYVVTGTAPNRVFTFQWLNWRWNPGAAVANISFQAKLYEGTNAIQFVYQPEAGPFVSANASATIGLDGGDYFIGDNTNYRDYVSLSDASTSPVLVSNLRQGGASMDNINTRPAAGQTYTLTPINDYCVHATPLAYGSTVTGNTLGATMRNDPRATCAVGGTGTPTTSPGLFYSLVGNGQTVTVSTCAGATATGGNTKLFVYSGTCGNFTCVGNNDDVLTGGCGTNPLASSVTFPTQNGTVYYVFVQFAQTGAIGAFGLRVSATGLATTVAIGKGGMNVFPNPASRTFTLQLPALGGERTAELTLLNRLGQVVRTRELALNPTGTQTQLEVSALPAGLYTVRVQTSQQVATRQLVVE